MKGSNSIPLDNEPALSISDLTKIYHGDDGTVTAIDGLSFEVGYGEIVGVLGPNGAGKTTTIKIALGLVTPTSGSVHVYGVPVHEQRSRAYEYVSAVLEGARNVYWRLTPRENLAFFAGIQGIDRPDRASNHERIIETLGLSGKADEPVRNLSRGMKQKVAVGCTLAQKTPMIFLDEPMLGLDVETSRDLEIELRRLASEEEKTIIITSHDMDVIEAVCDRVIVLDNGEIIANDSVENLLDTFQAQTYRVQTEEKLPTQLRKSLDERFQLLDWEMNRENQEFQIILNESTEFYQCIDILRAEGVDIQSFTEVNLDLEEIFVDLTTDESSGAQS